MASGGWLGGGEEGDQKEGWGGWGWGVGGGRVRAASVASVGVGDCGLRMSVQVAVWLSVTDDDMMQDNRVWPAMMT